MTVLGFFRKTKKGSIRGPSPTSRGDVQQAVTLQQNTIEMLNQREGILQDRIKECIARAKEKHANGDKQGALSELRRKKILEEEASRVTASIMTLESHSITLEGAEIQQMTLSALSTGASVHKRLQANMDTSKVDKLMEQLEEQRETQLEIFDAMTQGISMPSEVSQGFIETIFPQFEDELEELMQEEQLKDQALERELEGLLEERVVETATQPKEEMQTQHSESVPIPQ
ncbi:hypothetical protein BgAZ_108380 [Babesia gibsoni]|uniref:SNF7 family protein n=1 Tax=Babesia gibsoni TaxID=33632 RepID=A0AAD8PGN8_BABGI|nr:hypothetical protein BgAZ_108380 [Babesia gibsoni]